MDVIVPAYNEEKELPNLLKRMPREFNVIVVDDGSTDRTAAAARRAGVKVISLKKNFGKGKACLEGLKHCKTEYCAFIDGDNQLDPHDIKNMIPYLKKYDLVIGEREMKKLPLQRRLSNRFSSYAVNFITRKRFGDVLCGLRAFRKSRFEKIKFRKLDYCFEAEMIINGIKAGLNIKSVKVNVDYKRGSRMGLLESMKISFWLISKMLKKVIGVENV